MSDVTGNTPLRLVSDGDELTIDELAQRTGLEAATLAARLTWLEIQGTVQSIPGARFQRVK